MSPRATIAPLLLAFCLALAGASCGPKKNASSPGGGRSGGGKAPAVANGSTKANERYVAPLARKGP